MSLVRFDPSTVTNKQSFTRMRKQKPHSKIVQIKAATFGLEKLCDNSFNFWSCCNLNFPKNFTCPSGKLRTGFTIPIAKSTNPGLSDTTFFARWRHGLFLCFCFSLGLNGIKVIVKSLGSGFHLPVPGLPRYDLVSKIPVVKSECFYATNRIHPRDRLYIFMWIVHFSSIASAKFSRTRQVFIMVIVLTKRYHLAVAIFSKRSQRHKRWWEYQWHHFVLLLHFHEICDLLLNRPTAK